jgi:hypothetical protein
MRARCPTLCLGPLRSRPGEDDGHRTSKVEGPPPFGGGPSAMTRLERYPVTLGAAVTGTGADGAAAGPGGAGGVTGAATQGPSPWPCSLSRSSPPAPRPFDPVWQFDCRSPLASGSGPGAAPATEPADAANAATATRLTTAFFIRSPHQILASTCPPTCQVTPKATPPLHATPSSAHRRTLEPFGLECSVVLSGREHWSPSRYGASIDEDACASSGVDAGQSVMSDRQQHSILRNARRGL